MRDDELLDFLRRLGNFLSGGDIPAVADCWALPALVLGDQGAVTVTDREQLKGHFAGAVQAYRARGIASTTPEVLRVDRLTKRLTAVDVRWPYFDAAGSRLGEEVSGYVVWADDGGRAQIRVAYSRGEP
jgi:hypothetical protein